MKIAAEGVAEAAIGPTPSPGSSTASHHPDEDDGAGGGEVMVTTAGGKTIRAPPGFSVKTLGAAAPALDTSVHGGGVTAASEAGPDEDRLASVRGGVGGVADPSMGSTPQASGREGTGTAASKAPTAFGSVSWSKVVSK